MARRRRRKRRSSGSLTIAVAFVVFAAWTWLQSGLPETLAAHRTTLVTIGSTVAALLVAGAVAPAGVRWLRARRRARRDRYIAVTDSMAGPEFEHYTARLMRRDGLRHVTVCGGRGDLGADVTARTVDGRKVVVQCKRYAGSLGGPDVQKFNGTAWQIHRADVAVLVTTGRPTVQARELARRCGITLIDRDALAAWARGDAVPAAFRLPSFGTAAGRRITVRRGI